MNSAASIVECPRDAFQGLPRFIPTEVKLQHLLRIVEAGVREIDFGSFVSPAAVPQMADTEELLRLFRERIASQAPSPPAIRLIAVIANERGFDRALAARDASGGAAPAVGYPLSLSDTFQRNNTGKSIDESWSVVERLARRADETRMEFDVYLSMAFGNPYGEAWSVEQVAHAAARLALLGVRTILLADTVGRAEPNQLRATFDAVAARAGAGVKLGAHLHAAPDGWAGNVAAAYEAGCRRFDASLAGYGGCPFAQNELVGNIPTEGVVNYFERRGVSTGVSAASLSQAVASARSIFDTYGRK